MKRKTFKIKEWMRDRGYTVSGVAADLKISRSIVSETIYSKRNHRGTLEWLRSNKCPVSYLALPNDMPESES